MGYSFDFKFNAQFSSYHVILRERLSATVSIPYSKQVIILILSRCSYSPLYTRAWRGTFGIFRSRAERENLFTRTYPLRDFSTSVSCAYLPYLLYFIRSMKLYPPPRFCQPFSFVFPRFFNFCRFCGSFSAIFAFLNKKLSTIPRLRITRFFILQAIPLAAFVYKKVRQPQLPHEKRKFRLSPNNPYVNAWCRENIRRTCIFTENTGFLAPKKTANVSPLIFRDTK